MKFKFKIQPFQTDAVDSVAEVFNGQLKQDSVAYRHDAGVRAKHKASQQASLSVEYDDYHAETAYRNADIELSGEELLRNVRSVQTGNGITPSPALNKDLGAVSLDVEMETGTGKTYVYIKTMFELYKRYGWGKFIVVVPSIAIREGVNKTFELTQEHFMESYGIKARFFVYDSSNLHKLDEFSQNSGINVMIINTQAFNTTMNESKNIEGRSGNEAARIIYTKRDEFGSRRPIDIIKANRPIIILDEPQKMGGTATQNALKNNFNPLFSLNYSATHKNVHNPVYVLDALDAFNKKLVKKIEVKGFEIKNLRGTDRYLYLAGILTDKKNPPRARIELEVRYKGGGIKRDIRILSAGDSLYSASNELEEYKGILISDIVPRDDMVVFSNGDILRTGTANGNVSENDMRRIQIRETIQSHLDKEKALFGQGIKCLSLFFIDSVAKYRQYDEDGRELLGEYGRMFEEEYKLLLEERIDDLLPKYQNYLRSIDAAATHRGYFSIDKKGRVADSNGKRVSEFSDDVSAYDLILKDKMRLLSFEEPTRFIFSHSALREGWDNPNVFQICTLKQSDNAAAKRQEVGRGLRLCVDRFGERQDAETCSGSSVHNLNKLTVIASESYAQFVTDLQNKMREDLYERPLRASKEYFMGKTVDVGGKIHTITEEEAVGVYNYLIRNGYVDDGGTITGEYHIAYEGGRLEPLKEELSGLTAGIHVLVKAIADPDIMKEMISNGHETAVKDNPLNENFHKQEFQELWKEINRRYAYTVDFNSRELIEKSVDALNKELYVAKLQYTMTEGDQIGTKFDITGKRTEELEHAQGSSVRYDLIGKIAEGTTLTRRTAAEILRGLAEEKLQMFRLNPEEFIRKVIAEIESQKAAVVIEHISYHPSSEEPYTQDIFNISRTSMPFSKAHAAKKAVQDYIFPDGTSENSVERRFAEDLDVADEVVVYAKLPKGPKGFFIPTPVGEYSPDWAIAFKRGKVKHIFFIAETKGTMDSLELRPVEKTKITCAKKLFNEMSTANVRYHEVDSYRTLLDVMQSMD